ncbi:MAG: vWA domain-containing protein, partial [Planctomycetaceae bacterium]|nr:vWA domain-containing protein [Planctomycetaceae bacterium]
VDYVQDEDALDDYGVRDKFGGKTFICYILRHNPSYADCKDLWKTKHYPFHAIKEGHEILCDFLTDLGFDDYLGMVSYDTSHRIETTIDDDNSETPDIDISTSPLTNDYATINNLMKYKQAAHYSNSTNMSGGLKSGIELLDDHKRDGSRPAIILMTDGNSNTLDDGETGTLPSGWSWDSLFDYDGNGSSDYSTSSTQKMAVLKYVKDAVDKGYTVHAISVGNDADRDLLEAVAWLGNGYWVDVPGGMSASDMEEELREAFVKIASAVPPARLVKSDE